MYLKVGHEYYFNTDKQSILCKITGISINENLSRRFHIEVLDNEFLEKIKKEKDFTVVVGCFSNEKLNVP